MTPLSPEERMEMLPWIRIFGVIEYRGLVSKRNDLSFIIHTKEKGHNSPHVHVQYQDREVVIEITTGNILAGNIPSKKHKEASNWVIKHQEFFKKHWNGLVSEGVRFSL